MLLRSSLHERFYLQIRIAALAWATRKRDARSEAGMTYKTNNGFTMEETFKTKGTCATMIQFTRDGDKIRNIRFTSGCNGNLKAIAKLCEGMKAEDIAAKLLGNTCGGKPTSCADQLARAVLGKEA